MKVLKRIFFVLVALVLIFVIVGFVLPKQRHVERSIFIDAPPSVVFSQVNGFRNFNDWSPFVAVMPEAEYAYEGPDFGVGSKISWSVTGPRPETGSQTIVASTPYDRVDIELDLGPQGTAQAAYLLLPENNGTNLTWAFDTDFGLNLLGRYWGLLLDRQLGPLYAQGLANLKRISEDLPKVDWSGLDIGITEVPSTTIAYFTGSSGSESGGHRRGPWRSLRSASQSSSLPTDFKSMGHRSPSATTGTSEAMDSTPASRSAAHLRAVPDPIRRCAWARPTVAVSCAPCTSAPTPSSKRPTPSLMPSSSPIISRPTVAAGMCS